MRPTPPHAAPPLHYQHTVKTRNTIHSSADHTEVVPPAMHHTRGRDELRLVRTAVNTGHLLKTIPPRTTQRWSLPQYITLTGGTSSASSALPALPTHSQDTQDTTPPRTTRRWSLPSTTPTTTSPRTVFECRVDPTFRSLKLESPPLV